MWTEEQWAMFTAILRRGFAAKTEFSSEDAATYRLLLDGIEPDAAINAVRELVLQGQAFRPQPGEIAERARRDRSRPTFDEAYLLMYGQGGALNTRPAFGQFDTLREKRVAERDAVMARARELHPLIGSFIVRQGIDRLRYLPVDDPDFGELRRKELREAWDRHVETFDGRELVALSAGESGRSGLRRLDPLAALGLGRDTAGELEAGGAS